MGRKPVTRLSMKDAASGFVTRNGKRIAVTVVDSASPTKQRKHGVFVRVPIEWIDRLDEARNVGTVKLALRLLYANWRQCGAPVAASNVMARMDKDAKRRALAELEALGLIEVGERRNGQAPLVKLCSLCS